MEAVSNTVVIDTILTGNDFEDVKVARRNQVEDIYAKHDRYLPLIDSIIVLFNLLEDEHSWINIDKVDNIEELHSTEGNELTRYQNDIYTRYNLTIYGEMGRTEEVFYLEDNRMILLSTKDIRYNAPIYTILADSVQTDSEEVFDETKSEILIEDSYFENGKIIYQASQDCGAPNAQEYVKSVEKDVAKKLNLFTKYIAKD